jgi:hypothetical protein
MLQEKVLTVLSQAAAVNPQKLAEKIEVCAKLSLAATNC